tara:strand:- start:2243 stop:3208 length:966 start_codon:yes stop_codon:yes gene_type:complete
MHRAEDFIRDYQGGVGLKIVHLGIDAWIEAPSVKDYEAAYYVNTGFLARGLKTLTGVLELERSGEPIKVVRNVEDISEAAEEGKLALLLGFEGGKIIEEDVDLLDAWFVLGLRHIQLNWAMRNSIGASQSEEDEYGQPGLSNFGFEVISRMNDLGMIVDVSHSAPQTIKDVLATTNKPILNSHSASREIANKPQNLWDDQIRDMAENGGVIGIHFCSRLVLGVNGVQSSIKDVVRQIQYVVRVGGIEVVGLGPDYMLNFSGRDENYLRNTNQHDISWTKGLENSSEIYNLVGALQSAGFKESDIDKIASSNMLRLISSNLG